MSGFLRHKFEILKHILRHEGWRSYTRLDGGKWQRVKLPRGRWQHTFCADPLLFRYQGEIYVFFETMTHYGKGIVGCSKWVKGKWKWQGIALEEVCHLSYPQVFEEEGKIYMIPETCKRNPGDVCLYEAMEFPLKWKKVAQLIDRPFADATILKHQGHWYASCYYGFNDQHAELWHADKLTGPWSRHPMWDKVSSSLSLMRCGGHFIEEDGKTYRVAQDCDGFYGIRLWKVPVEEVSSTSYREGAPSLLVSESDEPVAMKHTYNRISWGNHFLEVVDIHHDVFRPVGEIVCRLWKAITKKFGK